jgi:4-hydroxybenzoate polyprenyltransferase
MIQYIRIIRPEQWVKNLFLFAGLIFSRHFIYFNDVLRSVLGFLVFCILSGAIYVINDIFDRDLDRQHPIKRNRPVASGAISVKLGIVYGIILMIIGLILAYFIDKIFFLTAILYVMLMLFYSMGIKQVVILDILFVAAGFVIRVVAGAAIIRVDISSWLLLCTLFLSLFLVVAKRRSELVNVGESSRGSLQEYSPALLDMFMAIVTTATIVSYALYTLDTQTIQKFGTRNMIFTVPYVVYGIFRYLFLVYQNQRGESPESIIIQDKPLIINLLLWIITVLIVII